MMFVICYVHICICVMYYVFLFVTYEREYSAFVSINPT